MPKLILPSVIGHRGCAAYAPENTLVGIHAAADLGCTWIELDVKLTKDSVPVIFHDDTLERTTNGAGKVADITLAALKDLEAGSWFGESFSGEPVPTLEEALEVIIERDLGFNLELKPCPSREIETTEAALDILSHYWDEPEKLLLSSFQIQCLEACLDAAPEWARGLLLDEEFAENWQDIARHLQVSTVNIDGNAVTDEQLEYFLSYGKPVLSYTINDEERYDYLRARGVKSVFSDMPDLFL
ncbi:MAG: glycerophosphoryl diester phosphodiesterase [Rhodospirillales bacterium]|nr:glycerophosphoryl diester phosphodiesterase [Rhodospirillales bacterium]MCB9964905.1 glycerophosphoryl diester phosphodiesterase [Rhodospirillales bacterium]